MTQTTCPFHAEILKRKDEYYPNCDITLVGHKLTVQPIGSAITLEVTERPSFRKTTVGVEVSMRDQSFFRATYGVNEVEEFFRATVAKYVYSQAMFDMLTRMNYHLVRDFQTPGDLSELPVFMAAACKAYYKPITCSGTKLTKQFRSRTSRKISIHGDPAVDETQVMYSPGESETSGRLIFDPASRLYRAMFRMPGIYGSFYKSKVGNGSTVNKPIESDQHTTIFDAFEELSDKIVSQANDNHTALVMLFGMTAKSQSR